MALANVIRRYRFHRGEMTQNELAKLIGVSRQTVIAIEGNKYPPSLEVAFRIAYVFDATIEDIFIYEPDYDGEHEYSDGLNVEVTWDGDNPNDGQ